jgi:dipeptidyl aminopeptidase/acylaminoacyl peptidase
LRHSIRIDGKRIAFVSDHTGFEEIWTTDSNGQDVRQVTSFGGPGAGSPRWSPDGTSIAFDSTVGGRAGIYVVAASGGAARRITSTEASGVRPSWARDGNWIYFGSDQSGDWQIWKTKPSGGRAIQVTRNGGREAFEAPGGEFVYYTKTPPSQGIWRVPVVGGTEVAELKVSGGGTQGKWALGGRGIYYLNQSDELAFQEFSTMRHSLLPTPGLQFGEGVANMMGAAADDRWILLTVLVRAEVHATLVRNFR